MEEGYEQLTPLHSTPLQALPDSGLSEIGARHAEPGEEIEALCIKNPVLQKQATTGSQQGV